MVIEILLFRNTAFPFYTLPFWPGRENLMTQVVSWYFMNWRATGAILMALGVGFGAFGAHSLRGMLDEYSMSVYERAVFYHFIHALGMLVPKQREGLVNGLLLAGIVFFAGSLYVLALSGQRWLGAVTPIGGVAFIAAWVVMAYGELAGAKPGRSE
jgi:uncharacterized membrane protein YgdD (TMEM256/DUF423 family)